MGWEITLEDGSIAEITEAVYFEAGPTTVYLNPEKSTPGNPIYQHIPALTEIFTGEMDEAARRSEPPLVMDLPSWSYQLLGSDGRVLGHGDHYLSEDAVLGVLDELVRERGVSVPIAAGSRREVADADAALGKSSATGSSHCPECGAKITVAYGRRRDGSVKYRAARDAEVLDLIEACAACGTTLPSREVA